MKRSIRRRWRIASTSGPNTGTPSDRQNPLAHPLFVIQTDNPGYWKYIQQIVPVFFDLHERIGRWPDAPKGRTRREIVAMKKGLPVFRGSGTAKAGLSEAKALQLAEKLPPPTFDADRRLRELDSLA